MVPIGKIKNVECKIVLENNAKPKIFSTRKIPLSLKDKVRLKLNEMEEKILLKKLRAPTDWVHPKVNEMIM